MKQRALKYSSSDVVTMVNHIAILGTEPGPVFLIYPSKRPPLILIRVDP